MRPSLISIAFAMVLLAGCSTLTLQPANYSWALEEVGKLDAKGFLDVQKHRLKINMKNLLFEETGDSTNVSKWTLRIIRDDRGFYFVTAERFKNVYVFAAADGAMKLHRKIQITEEGMTGPVFNRKGADVMLEQSKSPALNLTPDGIREGDEK